MKWMVMYAILLCFVFATKKVTFTQKPRRRETLVNPNDCLMINTNLTNTLNNALSNAVKKGDEENVRSVLATFPKSEEIQFLLKGNSKNITALHLASSYGHEKIVKMLLNFFNEEEKEKLIEYVMKKSYVNFTALHLASANGHKEIVKLLLSIFNKEKNKDELFFIEYARKHEKIELTTVARLLNRFKENDKLKEYVMQVDAEKRTALHHASQNGHEEIVNCLLDVFDKQDEDKLMKFLMQEDIKKDTALHFAFQNGNEKIINTLCDIFGKNHNRKLIEYLTKKK